LPASAAPAGARASDSGALALPLPVLGKRGREDDAAPGNGGPDPNNGHGAVIVWLVVSTLSTPVVACKLQHSVSVCADVLTERSSCEYRDDCEWREMKAKEAEDKYVEHKSRQAN